MRDIEVTYLNGQCLSIGRTRVVTQGYMRESAFYNFKCFYSGTATTPAVEIGSTTTEGSDATNELDFYKLAVLTAMSTGVAIRNQYPFSATRRIRFFGLRIEHVGGDGLALGDPADAGQVAEIGIYDLTVVQAKGAGLRFTGAAVAPQPYQISILGGSLGPGNGQGIRIDKGRMLDIDLANVDGAIILGPDAGDEINIGGNGGEHAWVFNGTKPKGSVALPLNLRSMYGLVGLPNSGNRVGAAALQATVSGGGPARLTMDGKSPDAYNCFNPGYGRVFNVSIQVIGRDTVALEKWFAWTLPVGVFSVQNGPASTTWTGGLPATLSGAGVNRARVTVEADRDLGCIALAFIPPPGNKDKWTVTAHIDFAGTW
jgi:hypothetical protein